MRKFACYGLLALLLCGAAAYREPVVGNCENCEAVFEGMPRQLESRARIGMANEPGEPLELSGVVYGPDGKPRPNVVVYAYQTNARGIYPTSDKNKGMASHRHGLLRGWALTDAKGRYAFDTIRPVGYPGTDIPQHIHMHVIERGCATYWIDDSMFRDDPRLTPEKIRNFTNNRGGGGFATPTRKAGKWYVTRDIRLGMNVPGYPGCQS